ncbi:hypothetical protein C366_05661 [Cryptococcus neoformans Tu401-1]|nr:hypothetical protein C366_05661 [Cryptococcus neoformans var. grubii Tu401-1]
MSMFSQFSFRPLDEVPKPRIHTDSDYNSPTPSTGIDSPAKFDDPYDSDEFLEHHSSRSSLSLSRSWSRPKSRDSIPEEDEENEGQIRASNVVRSHTSSPVLPNFGSSLPPSRRGSQDHFKQGQFQFAPHSMAGNRENTDHLAAPSPPLSIRGSRGGTSPSSRPPKLNALSPLQAFSPLQSMKTPMHVSDTAGTGSLRRSGSTSSVTRSLSRRESMIENAQRWRSGVDAADDGKGLFSRLTLVKAPRRKDDVRRHSRSKSSSSLAPFNSFTSSFDAPATSASGPRRSFAASSFGAVPPSVPSINFPSNNTEPANDTLHRVHSHGDVGSVGIQRKVLSPDEVLDMARSFQSPMLAPEGSFGNSQSQASSLKRRKSAGSIFERSPEPPVAAELEPVEYVQMEDDVLLPFVDRCAEVRDLMSHPSNTKLFALLRAAFPKEPARKNWKRISPEEWNWEEFVKHLTEVDRDELDDYDWVYKDRQAVRSRSVALWEKLGVCIGCDEDLLNAGSEDDSPSSWAGLGLGDESDYDSPMNHVFIAGIEPVDQEEQARAERQFMDEFGDIVEDENEQAAAGMTALLGSPMATIGEETPSFSSGKSSHQESASKPTPAQRAGNRANIDPLLSSSVEDSPPRTARFAVEAHRPSQSLSVNTKKDQLNRPRRSFVGLQICTSPTNLTPTVPFERSRSNSLSFSQGQAPQQASDALGLATSPLSVTSGAAPVPLYERGPGSPLFPSSFSSLSLEPNLGRKASVVNRGVAVPIKEELKGWKQAQQAHAGHGGLGRKPSQAGLSESAITFVSESDWSNSAT